MSQTMLSDAAAVQAAAQGLAEVADAIRPRIQQGFDRGELDLDAYLAHTAEEVDLRTRAAVLYGRAIDHVLADAQLPQERLLEAIEQAKRQIAQVDKLRRALKLLTATLVLAGAIVGRNAKGAVDSAKALAKLAAADPGGAGAGKAQAAGKPAAKSKAQLAAADGEKGNGASAAKTAATPPAAGQPAASKATAKPVAAHSAAAESAATKTAAQPAAKPASAGKSGASAGKPGKRTA